MRFYAFGNYYLSSLQQGLQAKHAGDEMENTYQHYHDLHKDGKLETDSPLLEAWNNLDNWRRHHKTVILLNGGNCKDLIDLRFFLMKGHDKFPYAAFREDEASLNNAVTSVAIVLPEYIYETAESDRRVRLGMVNNSDRPSLSGWEEELIVRLNQCGLAK